jgi:hypothetical protein
VGDPPVVGVLVVNDELPDVLDDAFGALEQTQRPTVLGVVGDGEVAAGEGLIALLAPAGVVEAVVWCPSVVVAVLLTRPRIGENQHVRGLAGGADAILAAATIAVMELTTTNRRPRRQ